MTEGAPLSAAIGLLGINGLTAWFGINDICKPAAGETVVVTAAAGGVGSIAVQLAKAAGARVIGIAGDDDKCRWVEELGAEHCINYKKDDVGKAVAGFCPARVDCIFDNVGGAQLDSLLPSLNVNARIALCGAISRYGAAQPEVLSNWFFLLPNRALMKGFIFMDHADRHAAARSDLADRLKRGEITYREDVVDGLENAPDALGKLFAGTNRGKLLVRIGAE